MSLFIDFNIITRKRKDAFQKVLPETVFYTCVQLLRYSELMICVQRTS